MVTLFAFTSMGRERISACFSTAICAIGSVPTPRCPPSWQELASKAKAAAKRKLMYLIIQISSLHGAKIRQILGKTTSPYQKNHFTLTQKSLHPNTKPWKAYHKVHGRLLPSMRRNLYLVEYKLYFI